MRQDRTLIAAAKKHFLDMAHRSSYPIGYIFQHMNEVEKWATWILKRYPKANRNVTLAGIWLHDIGQTFGSRSEDHAVKSGREATRFLKKIGTAPATATRIVHCARAHRCKDVQPQTIEAKIVVAADSASHFTDSVYIDIVRLTSREAALQKLERDYRDVNLLPGLRNETKPMYLAWKKLLNGIPHWYDVQ